MGGGEEAAELNQQNGAKISLGANHDTPTPVTLSHAPEKQVTFEPSYQNAQAENLITISDLPFHTTPKPSQFNTSPFEKALFLRHNTHF